MRSKLKIAALLLCALSVGAVMYFWSPPHAEALVSITETKEECETKFGGQWNPSTKQCQYSVASIPGADVSGCGISNFSFSVCAATVVYWIGPGIAGYAANIGAYFFSIVIEFSLNSTAYALDFLADGWQTVRDLANMAFIFILVFIAITIMLQAETTGTIKQLIMVIVIALLVNFSFLFTRVIIDAGNVLALQFYNAIPVGYNIDKDGNSTEALLNGTKDLSVSIMGALRIQELYGTKNFEAAAKACGEASGTICGLIVSTVVYIAVAAMLWMLFFSFLQVGVKFMFRIVALWLLLIASPLAFIAKTMKKTEEYFDKWWRYLIKFSFYPAIFLFMFLIITKFAQNILVDPSNRSATIFTTLIGTGQGSVSNGYMTGIAAGVASVGIRLGFILALMYIALHVSEWIVTEGSARAAKITGGATGRAFGFAGGVGRYTFGWAGRGLAQSNKVRAWAASGYGGKTVARTLTRLGTSTYDVRKTKVGRGLEYLGGGYDLKNKKPAPLDLGKPTEGGYTATFDARVKRRMTEAEYFKPSETQLNAAYKKAVNNLTTQERAALEASVKDWEEKSDPDNNYNQDQKRQSRKELQDRLKHLGITDEAKKIAGVDDKKTFADRLDTRTWGNAGKIQRVFFRSAADNEAAAKIRGAKNDNARILAVINSMSGGSGGGSTGGSRAAAGGGAGPAGGAPAGGGRPRGGGGGAPAPIAPTPANTNTPPTPPTPTTPAPAAPAPAAPAGPTPAAASAARAPAAGASSVGPLTPTANDNNRPANDNTRAANDNVQAANDNLRAANDNLRAVNDNMRAANDNIRPAASDSSSGGSTASAPTAPTVPQPAVAQTEDLNRRFGSLERATDALSRRVTENTNPETFRTVMRQELKRSAKQQAENTPSTPKPAPQSESPRATNDNTPPRAEDKGKEAA